MDLYRTVSPFRPKKTEWRVIEVAAYDDLDTAEGKMNQASRDGYDLHSLVPWTTESGFFAIFRKDLYPEPEFGWDQTKGVYVHAEKGGQNG